MTTQRSVELAIFDPFAVFAAKYPGWVLRVRVLQGCNERVFMDRREVHVDPEGDVEWAVAHAVAHLELDHHYADVSVRFSRRQEDDADALARLWLGVGCPLSEVA